MTSLNPNLNVPNVPPDVGTFTAPADMLDTDPNLVGTKEEVAKPQNDELSFSKWQSQLSNLFGEWTNGEEEAVKTRRKVRHNRVNVKDERANGKILDDETVIADRTVDYNTRADKTAYMQYLEDARTLLTFTALPSDNQPSMDQVQLLELNFTKLARYRRWKNVWYKIVDSAVLHGCNFVEVVFDDTKPLKCAVEYVRREDFIFPKDVRDVQQCDFFMKRQFFPLRDIKSNKIFNPRAVAHFSETYKERKNCKIELLKVYLMHEGFVHVAYYSAEFTDDWVMNPVRHEIGLLDITQNPMSGEITGQPAGCKFYPVFPLKFQEDEEDDLLKIQGRASMDIYTQEAVTALLSSTVNGARRAAGFYPSAGQDGDGEPSPGMKIEHGKYIPKKLNFFQPNWPNTIALAVIQTLSVRNQQFTGRTDFAAMSRQDTAKTATEIQAAQEQGSRLTSSQVSLFADTILEVYSTMYAIARSQALLGITNLGVGPDVLMSEYELSPSGDVEVIKRQEKLKMITNFFALLAGTPAGPVMIETLIKNAFPEEAESMLARISAGTVPPQELASVLDALAEALQRILPTLPPNEQSDLEQLISVARSMAQSAANSAGPAQPAGPAGQAPAVSNEPSPQQ